MLFDTWATLHSRAHCYLVVMTNKNEIGRMWVNVYSTYHFDSQCLNEEYSWYEKTCPVMHTMVLHVSVNVRLLQEQSCNKIIIVNNPISKYLYSSAVTQSGLILSLYLRSWTLLLRTQLMVTLKIVFLYRYLG